MWLVAACVVVKKIALEEGMAKGLCKGFLASVVRNVGGSLVRFFYVRAKDALGL